jgi:aminoglycoside phosphotransferase
MSNSPPDEDDTVLTEEELVMLHRIDERTRKIDQRVDSVLKRTKKNRSRIEAINDDLDTVDRRSRHNKNVITAVTGGISLLATYLIEKVAGVF